MYVLTPLCLPYFAAYYLVFISTDSPNVSTFHPCLHNYFHVLTKLVPQVKSRDRSTGKPTRKVDKKITGGIFVHHIVLLCYLRGKIEHSGAVFVV
ncbi:expressed protein [Echinococcus multilocularis]|uniref:Expressed protein n=1 Tax=Echinococcus multilocularis TaxID=6211 RepID=A0A068YE49_ECHMU|nr:expressed protein [Echinococcus multilocularis]